MKIKKSCINKIAAMICGNEPFTYYPYRSSSYLTKFFVELDLDYIHDGSTRSAWVENALNEINIDTDSDDLPSSELIKIIESLLSPDNFLFDEKYDLDKARESIQEILKINNLKDVMQQNGEIKVKSLTTNYVSDHLERGAIPEKIITFCPSVFKIPDKEINPDLIYHLERSQLA